MLNRLTAAGKGCVGAEGGRQDERWWRDQPKNIYAQLVDVDYNMGLLWGGAMVGLGEGETWEQL